MKKIKLKNLANKELQKILGGFNDSQRQATKDADPICSCGCRYADSGGSSSGDNNAANTAGGLSS